MWGRGASLTPVCYCYQALGIPVSKSPRSTQLSCSMAIVPVLPPFCALEHDSCVFLARLSYIQPTLQPEANQSGHATSLRKTIRYFTVTFSIKSKPFISCPKHFLRGPISFPAIFLATPHKTALSGLRHLGLCTVLGKLWVFRYLCICCFFWQEGSLLSLVHPSSLPKEVPSPEALSRHCLWVGVPPLPAMVPHGYLFPSTYTNPELSQPGLLFPPDCKECPISFIFLSPWAQDSTRDI